jgi:hypothetical protein
MAHHPLRDRIVQRWRWQVSEPFDARVRSRLRRLRNGGRSYRPLFIAGIGGSGTSLLALALWQRFDCAGMIFESAHQVSKRSFLHEPLFGFPTVDSYMKAISPHTEWSVEAGRQDLLELYRSYSTGPGDLVIDKGPDVNLVRAGFLARCFPEGRFLLLFRDPVACVEGLRRKWDTFRNDALSESIRFYSETHERFLADTKDIPDRLLAVDYETLVSRHDATLDAIAARLGLPPARRPRRLPRRPNVEGQGIRNVRAGRIEVVRDASDRARDRMDASTAAEVRASLGPLYARMAALPFVL